MPRSLFNLILRSTFSSIVSISFVLFYFLFRIIQMDNIFIVRSKLAFPGRYDYSLVTPSTASVNLTCLLHNITFRQTKIAHLREISKSTKSGCIKCRQEHFIERARLIHNDQYLYDRVDYKHQQIAVQIVCVYHNQMFRQPPAHHLQGAGCPLCGRIKANRSHNSDTNTFVKRVREVHKDAYTYESTIYEKATRKVIIDCPKHGAFKQSPNAHLRGAGCPLCNTSKLETAASNALTDMDIKFQREVRISPIDHNGKSRSFAVDFAFAINGQQCFVELDGVQHFEQVAHFKATLETVVERDRCKNNYCSANKIHLLRVSYKEIKTVSFWLDQFKTQVEAHGDTIYMVSNPDLYEKQAKLIL
jgi:hypothetical protein